MHGGNLEWRNKVENVKLRRLTPEAVQKWKVEFVKAAGSNPSNVTNARISANTFIRNSRSLFSKDILKNLRHLTLPSPLPFEDVQLESVSMRRYQSEIDPQQLLLAGQSELANAKPDDQEVLFRGKPLPHDSDRVRGIAEAKAESKKEAFKILILGLCVGLRRDEIDKLEWDAVLWRESSIRIQETAVFSPKHGSRGDIPMDPEVLELLHQWEKHSDSPFVIKGGAARPEATYEHYRADKHQKTLIRWLREKGLKANSPIHSLRKEYGSLLCQKAGIYVASRLLRHSDIRVTAQHYSDDRGAITSGLGSFLNKKR